ncbi:MAG TPA: TonB-dependent receptor [Kofleriaceae bacterium]|nr:TonB-dependent receptor [Kofleriaceae bacterium]
MRAVRLAVILAAALVAPIVARAQEAPPGGQEPADQALSATDEELLRMAEEGEVIVVWAERPDKPFDRDTEVRLTGEELAARGATDLGSALALLPDVSVRDVGRGGFNIDIRGARKGAVRILVDGVAVSDPYYGTFDVSTIPVTDIVEIRVSTAPASPIDGPGGPGGVVEVHTRDAAGARLIVGRVTSDSMPTLGAAATGRAPLAERLALRLSLSSTLGMQEYDTATNATVEERRRAATGAFRLEYRHGARRLALDGFADTRRYVSPPSDELAMAFVLDIDHETSGRLSAVYDDKLGADPAMQIQAQSWLHATSRLSRNYRDPAMSDEVNSEDLTAVRAGGMVLVTKPIGPDWRWVASTHVDHERARVEDTSVMSGARTVTEGDVTLTEAAGGGQFERGPVRVDGAAGIAAPIGIDASPWPEAKLAVKYRLFPKVELEAIGARKGRVPSLRERYEGSDGNVSLDPEMASHGELRATGHPVEEVDLTVAPYYRRTTGTVKVDPDDGIGLVNMGEVRVRGVDVHARARVHAAVELGASYQYARALSDDLGADPIDRFPKHRAEGWVRVSPLAWLMGLVRARYSGRAWDRGERTPAYVLWDASVTGTMKRDWVGVLRVDDILDAAPETRFGYHLPGRVISLALQGTWD